MTNGIDITDYHGFKSFLSNLDKSSIYEIKPVFPEKTFKILKEKLLPFMCAVSCEMVCDEGVLAGFVSTKSLSLNLMDYSAFIYAGKILNFLLVFDCDSGGASDVLKFFSVDLSQNTSEDEELLKSGVEEFANIILGNSLNFIIESCSIQEKAPLIFGIPLSVKSDKLSVLSDEDIISYEIKTPSGKMRLSFVA